jgi:ABC-type nitrate/sulfonate/bicarbonate transport system substrate-binding protein
MPAKISRLFRLTRVAISIGAILVGLFSPLSCATHLAPTPRDIAAAIPANVGFSDRPSWLSWEVARQKQFFQKYQANVDLKWFDRYAESVLALNCGLLDANTQTLADTIRAIAAGEDWVIVLVTDASESNIPDFGHLAITRQYTKEHPEVVQGLVNAWFESVRYIREKPEKADRIVAKRTEIPSEDYRNATTGTTPFGIAENLNAFAPGNDITHLGYAAEVISQLSLQNGAIRAKPDLSQLFDDRFVKTYAASQITTGDRSSSEGER